MSSEAATADVASGPGHDPEKRRQILAGARTVFCERGFDAASMGDIARAAGVSKGTLYVYFDDKADLFASLLFMQCQETAELAFVIDAAEPCVETVLGRVGLSFIEAITQPERIATLRMVIAIGGKFPEIGRRFLEAGPWAGIRRLADFLRAKVEQGVLEIDDVEAAASQFLTLCKDNVTTPILLGSSEPPDHRLMELGVRRAVHMFMCTYKAGIPGRPPAPRP